MFFLSTYGKTLNLVLIGKQLCFHLCHLYYHHSKQIFYFLMSSENIKK